MFEEAISHHEEYLNLEPKPELYFSAEDISLLREQDQEFEGGTYPNSVSGE